MAPTHYQIAYRWAKREVPENGLKGHHMFCDRETIYSYGYHFPIARFHDNKTVLFNADGYSVSTNRHKSIVRSALWRYQRDMTVWDVTVFTLPHANWSSEHANSDHALSISFYKGKIEEAVGRWRRTRKYTDSRMRDAAHYLAEFKSYCAFHKLNLTRILKADGELAAACAVITLNPVRPD